MSGASASLPIVRKIERRELISLFSAMKPAEEIGPEELQMRVGLDPARVGDRHLIYSVQEYCRDVCGFCIETLPGGRFRRATDDQIVGSIIERRRARIYRQSIRGAAETMAVGDFAALNREAQIRLLAHQSVFGAIALASHRDSVDRIGDGMKREKVIAPIDADAVMAAAKEIR